MSLTTRADVRQDDHDRIEAQVRAFIARGGEVEVIPRGVSGDNLTPRQRVNPPVMRAEERAAKKAQEAAQAAPRATKPHTPRARPEKPPRPTPKIQQVLEAVRAGHRTAKGIADHLGHDVRSTSTRLGQLRVLRLIDSQRGRCKQETTWRAVA